MKTILTFLCIGLLHLSAQETIVQEISMSNGPIEIPGELTYPKTGKKIPLLIFVHGSGNADRNGNQADLIKSNHIKQLADSINAKGIAFYRFDKRTSNLNNRPHLKNPRFGDLVDDVQLVITKFENDDRFSSIHIAGHSQGSLVAMLAVSPSLSSYISIAGIGTTVDKALIRQTTAQNSDVGKVVESHIRELMETDTIREVNPFLMALFAPYTQKYLKSWIVKNPSKILADLDLPILIIQGDSDSQVTVNDAKILHEANNASELVIIPKMNHVLKTVDNNTEDTASYTNPKFPLSTALVTSIVEFIRTHG